MDGRADSDSDFGSYDRVDVLDADDVDAVNTDACTREDVETGSDSETGDGAHGRASAMAMEA